METPLTESQTGAIIESGLTDWQILQQDATGFATLTLRGHCVSDQPGVVSIHKLSNRKVMLGNAVGRLYVKHNGRSHIPSPVWLLCLRLICH